MFVIHANSDRPPYIDTLGNRKKSQSWFRDALLHRLRMTDSPILRREAESIVSCACLLDVHDVAGVGIVSRNACSSALCPVCGLRPSTDGFRGIARGIDWYQCRGVPVYHLTISLPVVAPGGADLAIRSAWSLWHSVVANMRSVASIDWHLRIELQPCGDVLKAHFHAVVAVISLNPEKQHPRTLDGKLVVPKGVHPDLQVKGLNTLRRVGLDALKKHFPDLAALLANDEVANSIVHLRPVDLQPGSPVYLGLYLTKTLRCGMTATDLLDVSPTALEELLEATKPDQAQRSRRLSQSARNTRFSRKKSGVGKSDPKHRRRPATPRLNRAVQLKTEVDMFLFGLMSPAKAQRWVEDRGRVLAEALKADGDPLGERLYWKIFAADCMRITRRMPVPTSVAPT